MAIFGNAKSHCDIARFMKKHHARLNKDFGPAWKKHLPTTVRNIVQGLTNRDVSVYSNEKQFI